MPEKKFDSLRVLQMIFALFILLISIYGLVMENFNLFPLMFICMGAMFIVIGLREYKRTRSLWWGIFYLCVALFMLFTAI